jgi:zinc protease
MRHIKTLLSIILLLVLAGAEASNKEDIKSFTLENGMRVLVIEDTSIPNANMYLFWKVGSRNEVPGITGIAHFFEHMMFNGSKKYAPKMFDRTMEAAGGANNAYATEDLTVYTNWFPVEAMETIFDLEADRIANLTIDPIMVASERGVVASERLTGLENSNWRVLEEELKGAAFRAHPYSWSVIGHESDIAAWTQQDLEEFHKTYYAPNNALVVIAGDVELTRVKVLANKYFAPIPAQKPPREVRTVEPEQKGERRVFVKKSTVSTPNIMLGYHIPETQHPDYYALDLMAAILSEGNSSRLYRSLVDTQIALAVETYLPLSFDPNLFYFYAVAAAGVRADELERKLLATIAELATGGIEQEELEKAKNIRLMDFYRTLETINGKADTVGTYELYFGHYDKLFDAPQHYSQVTAADIQRVAQQYLKKSNRTVAVLDAEEGRDL